MPGKTPQLALDNYLHPLRQSLACVTDCCFAYTSAVPNESHLLTLAQPTAPLESHDGEKLWLSFEHDFKIQASGRGYKVTTLAYRYGAEDEDHDEILLYHWHPESEVKSPHLHVPCAGNARRELRKAHLPTLRISFEDFLLCLISEFRIRAVANAEQVLLANREAFRKNCSWFY